MSSQGLWLHCWAILLHLSITYISCGLSDLRVSSYRGRGRGREETPQQLLLEGPALTSLSFRGLWIGYPDNGTCEILHLSCQGSTAVAY